ncbi:MAG: hypothetical protein K2Q33_06435 [Gammaproteobacteria bacterium]|nr:hypothetical protein [Gammaproteobacteria bacterium]
MSAANSTIESLYQEVTELEAKLKEIEPSYSLDNNLEDFLCKINYTLILNPVVAADGVTYDRGFIEPWLEENDVSPWTQERLEHKNLIKNLDFSTRLIGQLEKEKALISKRLNLNNPETHKIQVQPEVLSNEVPSSSSAVLPSEVDSELVLTPISEEIPLPAGPAPTFFSPASHSASHSSSHVSPLAQTVSLNANNEVWHRCLELKNHLRLLADTADIDETFILNADEAKQKYVNIISFVEEQIERTGEMTSAEIELIQRALVPMTEYEISIPGGRVIAYHDIVQLSFEISEFSAEVEGGVEDEAEAEAPAFVAPIQENLPPPLSVPAPVLYSEAEFPWMNSAPLLSAPIVSSSLLSHSQAPLSESLSSGSSSFPTISLTEEEAWKRCLELKNLLGLPANEVSSRKLNLWSSAGIKQNYVNTIAWIEEKFLQNGTLSTIEAKQVQQVLQPMTMLTISTPDGRVINPEDISSLYKTAFRELSTATEEQIEAYTQLIAMCAKLDRLTEIVQRTGAEYNALLKNIIELRESIKAKIDEYEIKYPSIQPSRKAILSESFPGDLPAQAALDSLMHMLRMQFYSELPQNNKNSHIFTPDYEIVGHKFQSTPFSPCSREDIAISSGLTLFSADKINTSGLQIELDMLGIPAKIVRSGTHRFQHKDSVVGGVRIVFDCVDPLIFNVAIELQRIRYQHAPRSVSMNISQSEPSVVRSSLLSSSLFLSNSDLGLDPNPNLSSSSRVSKKG